MKMKIIRLRHLLPVALLTLCLASCSDDESVPPINGPSSFDFKVDDSVNSAIRNISLATANASAAEWDKKGELNQVVSPLSAIMAFGMSANLVDDDARTEILNAFGAKQGVTLESFNSGLSSIAKVLPHTDPRSTVMLVNSVWNQTGLSYAPGLADRISSLYNANVGNVDFNSAEGVKTVNDWLKKSTGGNVDFGFSPMPECRLAILNSLWFSMHWEKKFKSAEPKRQTFYNYDKSESTVDMMSAKMEVNVVYHEKGMAVEISYLNQNASMLIYAPYDDSPLTELSDFTTLNRLVSDTGKKLLHGIATITMPPFEIERDNSLLCVAKALGMNRLSEDNCVNDALFNADGSAAKINLSDIGQRIKITVNETGTEIKSTSHTSEGGLTAPPPMDELPDEIKFDSPFLFMVKAYGYVIAAGRVMQL